MKKFDWNGLKSRLKNRAFWVSVASFVGILGRQYGLFEVPDNYEALVDTGLSALTLIGFLNNPTTENKWYGDDK